MKINKKLSSKIFVAAFIMMTLFSVGSTVVSAAGNYHDTRMLTTYSGDESEMCTEGRGKWDYTSSYIKNTSYSETPLTWINVIGLTSVNASWTDAQILTYGQPKDCAIGQSQYLPNLVKESGYNYCRLTFQPDGNVPAWLNILWSPDSI